MSILIKNVFLDGKEKNIFIEKNKISDLNYKGEADFIIDGKGKAIIPGLINTHTHAAMTLLRSYADDMNLQEWLEQKIWPAEEKLTNNDIYVGTKLACLEMIKSGTTCFNDMYHKIFPIAKAVKEMGLRGFLSEVYFDSFIEDFNERKKEIIDNMKKINDLGCRRIITVLGPHAIYTVKKETLQWTKDFADRNNMKIHIHLSETEKEVNDCIKQYGKRPIEFLNEIGFLDDNVIAAHCVWLNDNEIKILADKRVKVSYNPTSNMKLSVGRSFPYKKMLKEGIIFGIGTDGASSNNNLDMFESMKFASLLQKHCEGDPMIAHAKEIFDIATVGGGKVLGLNFGKIEVGYLADLILINLKKVNLVPNNNLISNLVYSANGSCVSDVIVDGKILMQDCKVKGEEKILEEVEECVKRLKSE
jgi:5-methylthioadenosine/S-adenosylhomocysteine deaminase